MNNVRIKNKENNIEKALRITENFTASLGCTAIILFFVLIMSGAALWKVLLFCGISCIPAILFAILESKLK